VNDKMLEHILSSKPITSSYLCINLPSKFISFTIV
jgi:hypothetical protein